MTTEKTPFNFVNSASHTKEYLMETEFDEKQYVPYVVNKAFSYFRDTILYANEINKYSSCLDNKLQYDFYFNAIPKKKRFSKWHKPPNKDLLALICSYYKYSESKARAILPLLSDEQIKTIRKELETGGSSKDGVD